MPDAPRVPRRREARRVHFVLDPRPTLLVLVLVGGSIAASALTAGEGEARPPSTTTAVDPEAFRRVLALRVADQPGPSMPPVSHPTSRSPIETVAPAPPLEPAVVRFRPRHGSSGVSRRAEVSVRFSAPMDHPSTEAAFRALVGEKEVTGSYRWAEGDTVLVLRPTEEFPYGAKVQLLVDATAHSIAGLALAAPRSVTFTVQPTPAPATAPPAAPGAGSGGWQWPLRGPITQRFGESLTRYGVHQGLDIDGQTGDPVRAARAGRVTVAGSYDQCGGLEVHIDHGGELESWYRHLSRIDVAAGVTVAAGTVIGRVGNTGCSLGSHLHFGVRLHKVFVDPLRYLPPR